MGWYDRGRIYKTLSIPKQEIRILHVEPNLDQDGLVQCRLEPVSLTDPSNETNTESAFTSKAKRLLRRIHNHRSETPSYEAISWTWGNSTARAHIKLNGIRFEVSKNAEEVLRFLCVAHSHHTVWMDAICIDQHNVKEKVQQIELLGSIYRGASRVLVWLGEARDTTEAALASIDRLVEHCRGFAENETALHSICFDNGHYRKVLEELPDCDWRAVTVFFEAAWFCRVWVAQEVMLGASAVCYCGSYSRTWDHIGLAAEWLKHHDYERDEYFGRVQRGIEAAATIRRYTTHPCRVTNLLDMSIELNATLPHDKVYGILGILWRGSDPESRIRANYNLDLAVLYALITQLAISGDGYAESCLEILQLVEDTAPSLEHTEGIGEWPTWVPKYHWTRQDGTSWNRSSMRETAAKVRVYGSAANMVPWKKDWTSETSTKVLMTSGCVFDQVNQYTMTFDEDVYKAGEDDTQWMLHCDTIAKANGILDQDTALTLTCGSTRLHTDARKDPLHAQGYQAFRAAGPDWDDHMEAAETFWNTLVATSWNRSFFATKETRHVGMGPLGMRQGDYICILYGSAVPFVFRQESDHWLVIGTAYVHGIMDGEYIQKLQAEGRSEEETQCFEIH